MSANLIINFVLFQIAWFSCVLGAGAYQMHWLAMIAVTLVLAHVVTTPSKWTDLSVAFAAVLIGYALDTIWVASGILSYPAQNLAPYWLALLWFGFGLSLNHSLKFFRDLGWLGALVVGAFGPVTYFTAERFGVVAINAPLQLVWVTATWLLLFRALSFFSVWHLGQNPLPMEKVES